MTPSDVTVSIDRDDGFATATRFSLTRIHLCIDSKVWINGFEKANVVFGVIIGNTFILLFTWSGFILIGLIGYMLKSRNCLQIRKIPTILGAGILGILLYDLWTNFGCWLGWYPKTISGLGLCYTMSIPFTLWHLLSTTIALTIVLIPILYLKEHKEINMTFTGKPLKKHTMIAIPATLMIIAIITILV